MEEGSTELITPKKSLIERLVIADSLYGISGLVLLYTGVQRVSHYAKGWEYYQHEPIFWVRAQASQFDQSCLWTLLYMRLAFSIRTVICR